MNALRTTLKKWVIFLLRHPLVFLGALAAFVILLTFLPFGQEEEKTVSEQIPVPEQVAPKAEENADNNTGLGLTKDADSKAEQTTPPPAASQNPEVKRDKSSPYDDIPSRRRAAIQDIAEDPAVQFLPYRGSLILADIQGKLGDKLVVHVFYVADKMLAEREWREFLKSHGDDGSSYQVVYIEKEA